MNSNDLEVGAFFTTDGKDIWKLESFYTVPSCDMVNLETGEKSNFGIGGLIADNFHKIKMPEMEKTQ